MSANKIKKNSWRLFKKVKLDNKRVRKRAREERARPRREKKIQTVFVYDAGGGLLSVVEQSRTCISISTNNKI